MRSSSEVQVMKFAFDLVSEGDVLDHPIIASRTGKKSLHGGSIPSEASNGFPHEIRGLGRGVVAPTVSQRPGAA